VNPEITIASSFSDSSRSRVTPDNPFTAFPAEDIRQSIASRFEQIVARDPSHFAVSTKGQTVSYGTLNRMANRIARAILSKCEASNEPVAVLVENDASTIAAILGVLKAGKIYVPLDVSYSPTWAKFILRDTNARIVLTGTKRLRHTKPWLNASHILIDFESIGPQGLEESPTLEVPSSALSHILYTSGSTGNPKGVMDDHQNTLHYVKRLTNATHISATDHITLVRPPSSSGALMNLYLALLNGSTLFPIDLKQVDMTSLADWLRREAITIFHAGGTVFRHFAQQLQGTEQFPDLRLIRLSSGQIFRTDVELFKRYFPCSLLLHVLSSTEANTYRVHFVDKNSPLPDGPLPVGYAVEDMEVLILDENGKALGENQVGEIAIRSAYLFPGYWNNSELTKAAFPGDPDAHGRRTFRTGDLGRLRSNDCLEYLGRKDFRLKIRGHSIQAEGVELALLQIPGIVQAAVAAHKDGFGDDRLVAYLAAGAQEMPTIGQIRESLKDKLPVYMVPTKFVILKSLPLNPNGKINRQELPAPDLERPNLGTIFANPSTPVETVMAGVWSEALGVNNIGINDVFFELGGDSLIAGRIITRLSRIFPWNLTLPEFYTAPTVAKFAQLLLRKASSADLADKAARLSLKIDSLSSTQVEAMVAKERQKRP
jgi:amino acid adenylation domain-containing protein